jgi:hypothetical protein
MFAFWKISNLIVLGGLIVICGLGTFYKHISFGLGLGDILGYLILYAATITHIVLTLVSKNKRAIRHIILTVTFSTFTIIFSLYATIWRGHEYAWNGSIFYLPCATTLKIENESTEKNVLIQMCSMEYYSKFTGTWNGKQIIIKSGEIKVPKDVEAYIESPITKIDIVADSWSTIENDSIINKPRFYKDTLKLNYEYSGTGEIIAVKNHHPVVRVTIK